MQNDKQITQSILVMLCSMRGTEIAKVEGLWLVNRPKLLVSEDPDDSPKVSVLVTLVHTCINVYIHMLIHSDLYISVYIIYIH